MANPSSGPGATSMAGMAILRCVLGGEHLDRKIGKAVASHVSGPNFAAMLAKLEREGMLKRGRGGLWYATTKAQAAFAVGEAPPMVPYRAPAAPPRRPGSDHSHIPSIAAGREFKHRHPI